MKNLIPLAALLMFSGCGDSTDVAAPDSATSTPTVDASAFLLDAEPDGAMGVVKVRTESKDGDEIVIVGRIGGNKNPWIDGRAAFSIVDMAAKPCNAIPGDKCPVPWDYCCEDDLASKTTLVKFNDENGKLVAAGAKDLFGLKELDTVVISGKAKVDDAGNVTVMAEGMFVRTDTESE